jgi:hypothetical protein
MNKNKQNPDLWTAGQIYKKQVDLYGSQDGMSELLAKQGIPGIRYLDGSSRTAGAGSSNFVLFDDAMPRIIEVNGQPTGLLPWAEEAKKVKKK